MTRCFSNALSRLKELIAQELRYSIGNANPRKIVLKPNWVLHETDPAFPISALVTDARIIEAVAEVCLDIFPNAQSILIGDCPLQYADWPLMCRQSGLDTVIIRLQKISSGRIQFRDLRKDVFRQEQGSFLQSAGTDHGDPLGYIEVELGSRSHLEPIADQADKFAVNDYSSAITSSNHRKGSHKYLVSRSILEADLIINLPKWKSHQKSGITCALKNLVGINGDKAYLPHFRRGAPKWGGDEYKDENRWLYWLQTRLREKVQKRNQLAYKLLKPGWELIKKVRGIETRVIDPSAVSKKFYVAGGAWSGNDTIWRMIYDLNLIIQCADVSGKLHSSPQRKYFCVVDGLTSGEGNGPLQPLPRETDWLIFGDDPFAIDTVLSWCMGFNPAKLPILSHRAKFAGPDWGDFVTDDLELTQDCERRRLAETEVNFHFIPPPGWRTAIER
jgi:uncharacterized protein (DUF362 family)